MASEDDGKRNKARRRLSRRYCNWMNGLCLLCPQLGRPLRMSSGEITPKAAGYLRSGTRRAPGTTRAAAFEYGGASAGIERRFARARETLCIASLKLNSETKFACRDSRWAGRSISVFE